MTHEPRHIIKTGIILLTVALVAKFRNSNETIDRACCLSRLFEANISAVAFTIVVGANHNSGIGITVAHHLGGCQEIADTESDEETMLRRPAARRAGGEALTNANRRAI